MTTRLLPLLAIVVAVGLVSSGCDKPMGMNQPAHIAWHWVPSPEVHTLWAGQNQNAGTVTVWNTGDSFYIKYEMTGDWWLEESHAHVALSLEGIPQRNGNPTPGRFEFNNTFNPRVKTHTYAIALRTGWNVGVELYVATHAVAVRLDSRGRVIQEETGWAGPHNFPGRNWAKYLKYTLKRTPKDVTLPDEQVRMRALEDGVSFFDIELADVPQGYDVWNGWWRGWCAERSVPLTYGQWYWVKLWSTANPNLPPRCANAGWDNVNYLLNHRNNAAMGDMQRAIWYLLGTSSLPSNNFPVARQMALDAEANGDGWFPTAPGSWIAVICETASEVQLCFIEVDP